MNKPSGIGKLDRERLSVLLRGTKYAICVDEAKKLLNLQAPYSSKLLARWAKKGWLSRIKRGVYIPIPLTSETDDVALEDPCIIATKLYSPCYVGGWRALEHYGLTEQLFQSITIFTTKKPRDRHPKIKGIPFILRTIPEKNLFGLKTQWRDGIKVLMSSPTRTIVDLLINPSIVGGIRNVVDILINYLKSDFKNLKMLVNYLKLINNSAAFKRLGFLMEEYAPKEKQIIQLCNQFCTISKTKLDPKLTSKKFVTRWRLWVPKNWEKRYKPGRLVTD
ncbi:MAG: hypothetical protein A3G71_02080 [Gammaproteobacteria bacterium RIFCSPLOWO2_12_FULL_38_14]|nr:MAG: hypothetical protein A3G71_02080 [Gammaproteobacteria bacterium RIFCSPLOWO2_12_FULL_38_14]